MRSPHVTVALLAGAAILVGGIAAAPPAKPATQLDPAISMILGRPTDRSVTLSVLSDRTIDVAVDTGTSPTKLTTTRPLRRATAGAPVNFEIAGLTPDRTYTYRLRTRSIGASSSTAGPTHTFHTQRPSGATFTFTIDADPHYGDERFNGELYTTTLRNAVAAKPDFHIDLGDTFMTEKGRPATEAAAAPSFTGMRLYLGVIGADAPLFLVNGNHEAELGWLFATPSQQDLPRWATELRQRYYPSPVPTADGFYRGAAINDAVLGTPRDAWYTWTWGDARFIVLDPFWNTVRKPNHDEGGGWDWTLGAEQYHWLESTLTSNTKRFTFVFIHHLVGGTPGEARGGIEVADRYEWGGRNADGTDGWTINRPGWTMPIHQLLVRNGVTAVFHGHDHVYVHQELDGIDYQETPQPSTTNYQSERLATDYGYLHGDVRSSSGHLTVTVSPEKAVVQYVRAYLPADERSDRRNGTVADAYTLVPRPRTAA